MKSNPAILAMLNKYRRAAVVSLHILFIIISYLAAFYIRFEFSFPSRYWQVVFRTIPLLLFIKLLYFHFFGLFGGLWRYASISDLWRIIWGNILSSLTFVIAVANYHGFLGFPRSVIMIDFFICSTLVSGVRLTSRMLRERGKIDLSSDKKKVVIVGAGDAGISILRECRNNPHIDYEIVGFVDDDPLKKGHHIYGVKVHGGRAEIPRLVEILEADEIILAIPSAKGSAIREILAYCESTKAGIKIVPGMDKIISGAMELKPRSVRPEDLLGRKPVSVNESEIGNCLSGKRVLVTGAGGSIGSELARQISRFNPENLVLLDNHENYLYYLGVEFATKNPGGKFKSVIADIKDVRSLVHIFRQFRPHAVFHAAAHKHVPLMEENPAAAIKNNIIGTRNLIYAAHHYKTERFVLISTDKAVNPANVMGATKRIAEMILQAKALRSETRFMAVRFGNVLGSTGSVIPLFKKQIEEGGPVTVTHPEVKRYFMSIPEAARLVLQAGALGKGGEIFVLDMGEQIKIVEIARNLIALSGLKPDKDIQIIFTGLRPGEKLYEEILLDKEKSAVTKHDMIFVSQAREFDLRKIRRDVDELKIMAERAEDKAIIAKFREMIPGYTGGELSGDGTGDRKTDVK